MGEMNFQIYVYSADGEPKSVAANIVGEGSDTSYIRGKGNIWLVQCTNLCFCGSRGKWKNVISNT